MIEAVNMTRPKKKYGQHFLTDPAIAERIAGLLTGKGYDVILEVGPGKGVLTQFLISEDKELYLVEIDRDMISILEKSFPSLKEHIINQDFLQLNLPDIIHDKKMAIIGNFPYNISSQIIFKMLDEKESVKELAGMFQKELAKRITAGPGGKEYGVISILLQVYYKVRYCFTVGKGSFFPAPKVDGGVIHAIRRKEKLIDTDEAFFIKIVKLAFQQRRKKLSNALSSFVKDLNNPELEPYLDKRAEQLTIEDFVKLSSMIYKNTQ